MPIPHLTGGQLKVLSEDDVRKVHAAVVTVLEEVGVRVEYRPALELFRDHGCRVDFDKRIVFIAEHVLRKALSTAPSAFTLCAKSREWDVNVDLDRIYTIGGSCALEVLDLDGVRRTATLQDLVDLTRLQDALDNLHIMHSLVVPQDIPQPGFERTMFATVMKHTTRNFYSQGQGPRSVRDQVEMAAVVQGSSEEVRRHPIFTIVCCLISPLTQTTERVAELMESARLGIPVYVEVDTMAGATAPVTIAGALVEECANVLCGITLAQLVSPGCPCIFSIASGIFNMANGQYAGAAPESDLLHAATAQMARFYKLPFQGGTGIEATVPDAQAGYERALQVLTNALAGANFIHLSVGMMEQMLLASYEQCVIDDEIIGAAFRITRGLEVNDETLAVDVIREIGPGGNFLGHDHTARNFRRELWFPKVTNRETHQGWMAAGGKDMRQRANERARHLLATHHPRPLTPEQERELDRISQAGQQWALAHGLGVDFSGEL
ncbi:MAG: trimethylamine methyltransferase family protein [Armatimonadota bacterium]